MTGAPDITYRESGLFVRFFPETSAGEAAWSEMAKHSDGTGAFLISQKRGVIAQLRQAGLTVSPDRTPPLAPDELDALLAEIDGLAKP